MIDANIAAASSSYVGRDIQPEINLPNIQARQGMAEQRGRVGRMVLATFVAAIGPLSFGFAMGYSSSALLDFAKESNPAVRFTDSQGSWFGALLNVGAILGGPLGGWMIEVFGRKSGIILCGIPFEIGWLLITYAKNHWMLYFGRFINGMGVGMISLMVPVYIAEISSAKLRGMLGSVNQLAVTIGLVLSYSIGALVEWRWLAFIAAIPPALLVLLMIFMPETPVWSLAHNRRNEAIKALLWFKGPSIDTEDECYAIESTFDNDQLTCSEFTKPGVLKPLFLSLMVMFFQQFSGMNAVLFNCGTIFKDAGFENAKAVSIIVAAVQFFGTAIACLIMDKAGRKCLLWTCGLGMAISFIALATYFEMYIPSDGSATRGLNIPGLHHTVPVAKVSWLAIVSLILFNLTFALSWGPIPWLLMSELFPLKARGIASSISTMFNWSLSFIVTKTYINFEEGLTPPGTYLLYGGISFAAFLFVLFFLPETKGKTLEEIQSLFDKKQRSSYERIE